MDYGHDHCLAAAVVRMASRDVIAKTSMVRRAGLTFQTFTISSESSRGLQA